MSILPNQNHFKANSNNAIIRQINGGFDMLTKQQRDTIERDYLLKSDGQIAISIQATRHQVEHYRRKIGLSRGQNRIAFTLENTLLKDEIVDLMCLGWSGYEIARELGEKYLVSRETIRMIINKKVHAGTRRKWREINQFIINH